LSGLTDQRIAAGVMLVPGSIAFAIAAALALTRWLGEGEPRAAPDGRLKKTRVPTGAGEKAGSWQW
jgi:hypothetical protein